MTHIYLPHNPITTYTKPHKAQAPKFVTEKQAAFIDMLVKERTVTDPKMVIRIAKAAVGTLPRDAASDLIGDLKVLPKESALPPGAPVVEETKPGFYVRGDDVFKVVISKTSNKPYAKQMVVINPGTSKAKGTWEYAPGIAKELATLTPLSASQAGVLGKKFGACMICGRTLTAKHSIEAGIGPICAGKL